MCSGSSSCPYLQFRIVQSGCCVWIIVAYDQAAIIHQTCSLEANQITNRQCNQINRNRNTDDQCKQLRCHTCQPSGWYCWCSSDQWHRCVHDVKACGQWKWRQRHASPQQTNTPLDVCDDSGATAGRKAAREAQVTGVLRTKK